MKAETEAIWAKRVEEWRKSGKTAPEFAADKPYAGSTLLWAASRLRLGGRRAKKPGSSERADSARGIRMAKVVRRLGQETPAMEMVIEIAGTRIPVRRGFDGALLREVVSALREGR